MNDENERYMQQEEILEDEDDQDGEIKLLRLRCPLVSH